MKKVKVAIFTMILICCLCGIYYLSTKSPYFFKNFPIQPSNSLHIFAYIFVTSIMFLATMSLKRYDFTIFLLTTIIITLLLGGIDEYVIQAQTLGRDTDIFDIVRDLTGCLIANGFIFIGGFIANTNKKHIRSKTKNC